MTDLRADSRTPTQLRPVTFERNYTKHAEGSVLVSFGDTKVLCTASVEAGVPRWLKGRAKGGLPPNMVCCLVPPILAINEKLPEANSLDALKKSSV